MKEHQLPTEGTPVNLKTQADVQVLALANGFTDAQAEIAAAIAMAETLTYKDGKQYADFDKVGDLSLVDAKWGPSYGGWQIRSLKTQSGTGQYRDGTRLPEPSFNAKSAFQIFKEAGSKFTPWSTFTSGAYLGYMQHAKLNPIPQIPAGSYMVTGGDTLSTIGRRTGFEWQLIAAINSIKSPYTIFPGQVILLPDWPYRVQAGDTLSSIATKYSEVTWQRIAEYNQLADPNKLSVGQTLKIPRYTSWDGKTLVV
jgi:nucleoid-associated protein YgaU